MIVYNEILTDETLVEHHDSPCALLPFPVLDTIRERGIENLNETGIANYIMALSVHAILIDPTNAETVMNFLNREDTDFELSDLHNLYNDNFNQSAKNFLNHYMIHECIDALDKFI